MFDQIFLTVNTWMMAGTALAALGCFLWGMISVVFSPCHLASIPLIVSYVAGQDKALQARHAVHYAVAFTVGLFVTIAMVGVAVREGHDARPNALPGADLANHRLHPPESKIPCAFLIGCGNHFDLVPVLQAESVAVRLRNLEEVFRANRLEPVVASRAALGLGDGLVCDERHVEAELLILDQIAGAIARSCNVVGVRQVSLSGHGMLGGCELLHVDGHHLSVLVGELPVFVCLRIALEAPAAVQDVDHVRPKFSPDHCFPAVGIKNGGW